MNEIARARPLKAPAAVRMTPVQGRVLQRRPVDQSEPVRVPPIVHEVISSPGQPLGAEARAYMEPLFGHDFSQVRVHGETAPGLNLQAKLEISDPTDVSEQEADQTADAVLDMPSPKLSQPVEHVSEKTCSTCGKEAVQGNVESHKVRRRPQIPINTPNSARWRPVGDVEDRLRARRSGGSPLPDSVRRFFEPRFGRDFSTVRVHVDAASGRLAQDLRAQAFTVGNHIFFAPGRYAPDLYPTRRLLAHELTHFVQQQGRQASANSISAESNADLMVQRQEESAPVEPIPGPTLMMAKPEHFPQTPMGCWASAIASWRLVKGLDTGITDQTLIRSYRGTACTDSSDALVGDNEADVEAVFAEWRLLLNLSAEVPEASLNFHFFKSLIKRHGHFIIVTGDISLMHAMVVYGVRWNDKSDSTNFTLFVEDPLSSDNEKHQMFIERPIRFALGTEKSAGPAPCRSSR